MRFFVVVVLLAGCMDEVSLVSSGDVRMSVYNTKVTLAARGDREDCVVLPELLHGAVNGRRMTVVSRGDQETHGEWDFSEDDGDGSGYEPGKYTVCSNAELAMPLVVEAEKPDEVWIEVADHSATFVAMYPELYTPTTLALDSTSVVDDRLVVTWIASPSLRSYGGSSSVELVSSGRQVQSYGWRVTAEGNAVHVTFPEREKLQSGARYIFNLGATVVPTLCEGFSKCEGMWRVDEIDLDPALVEMALAL